MEVGRRALGPERPCGTVGREVQTLEKGQRMNGSTVGMKMSAEHGDRRNTTLHAGLPTPAKQSLAPRDGLSIRPVYGLC